MPQHGEFSGPMVSSFASLSADQARRQHGKECKQFAAREPTGQDDLARFVNAVNLENTLRNVETDCGNFNAGAPSFDMATLTTPPYGTEMPLRAGVHPNSMMGRIGSRQYRRQTHSETGLQD